MKLTCGCLNVQINAKCKELKPSDINELGITNGNPDPDQFFQMDLAEVSLDLEGVHIEHTCLMKMRNWENWTINRCLNCDLLTHATNTSLGNGKILVNTSLKSDITIQESLMKSPDFSPLYKIVIHNKNDNYQVKSLGLESGQYESLRKALSSIQQQLDTFLTKEEMALEARIRKYEEQQRSQYLELQSKVRTDKNILISLILANEEEVKTDASNSNREPEVEEKPVTQKPKTLVNKVKPPASLLQARQNQPKVETKRGKEMNVDIDELDVFDLEDVHDDDGRAFYMSDDENDDTDDSTNEELFSSRGRMKSSNPSYISSSMPVRVPDWGAHQSRSRGVSYVSDELDEEDPAPKDMAASIKALAQSVHGDGTEIFGDLPRRPRNAMDMGNI